MYRRGEGEIAVGRYAGDLNAIDCCLAGSAEMTAVSAQSTAELVAKDVARWHALVSVWRSPLALVVTLSEDGIPVAPVAGSTVPMPSSRRRSVSASAIVIDTVSPPCFHGAQVD